MGQRLPNARLSRTCAAPPAAIYDLLADLRSHLQWGGAQQSGDFRLLSLDAPDGPAGVGTVFSSTGSIPMSGKHWEDRSTVTVAVRPSTFEFVTEAHVGTGTRAMLARYVHRYDVAPTSGGSLVTYTMTQEQIANPFLRLGLPLMRQLTWRFAIPMMAGRGFRNLLAAAEAPARTRQAGGDSMGTSSLTRKGGW
jgi:hypothetical protein